MSRPLNSELFVTAVDPYAFEPLEFVPGKHELQLANREKYKPINGNYHSQQLNTNEATPPRQHAVGCGLINQGNTCFLNATLQCLWHVRAVRELCAARRHSSRGACRASPCAWCLFEKLAIDVFARLAPAPAFSPGPQIT